MNNIEKTLKYYPLIMKMDNLSNIKRYELPNEYLYKFYSSKEDIADWIKIHINSQEFTDERDAKEIFNIIYGEFVNELNGRLFFTVDKKTGEKIATATISPANENGYKCVIDWLAISKNYQGKGLSKPLLFKTLQTAKDLGYDKILLHTQTHTWLAAKLYLDFGFEPVFEKDLTGWKILKQLTNHKKLDHLENIEEGKIYNQIFVNIVNELNKLHSSNYTYEIWDENGKNDISVRENKTIYKYKFFNDGKTIKLIN